MIRFGPGVDAQDHLSPSDIAALEKAFAEMLSSLEEISAFRTGTRVPQLFASVLPDDLNDALHTAFRSFVRIDYGMGHERLSPCSCSVNRPSFCSTQIASSCSSCFRSTSCPSRV
ncbi:hypothetical protein EXIGLDRAFT_767355 [Exidia glandulosa HHB12029]|uniref:Uncharacterized protein n=1 Tax=Exidia glandulosa HHB12029 TaxID=1314781 RepID=A0A165J1B9_EXIGL|nr:hypothetical protein EXIGLDRAFT_767355 [Exidia glandulosa HHB12029]